MLSEYLTDEEQTELLAVVFSECSLDLVSLFNDVFDELAGDAMLGPIDSMCQCHFGEP